VVTDASGPALEPVTGPTLGPVDETADAAIIGVDGEPVTMNCGDDVIIDELL